MSLRIGLSRAHEYALVTGDRVIYGITPDGPPEGETIGELQRSRLHAISDNVLVAFGGCMAIADDCLREFADRVTPPDDLAACATAARAVIAELEAKDDDLAETEFWNHDLDFTAIRSSIRDHFNLKLVGFQADGSTGVVHYQGGEWDAYDDDYRGELSVGAPYGVDVDQDVVPFYLGFYASPGCATAAEAFSFAFGVHRILGRKYPERVTRHVDVVLLRWQGQGERPRLEELELDREDLDAFTQAYEALASPAGAAPLPLIDRES